MHPVLESTFDLLLPLYLKICKKSLNQSTFIWTPCTKYSTNSYHNMHVFCNTCKYFVLQMLLLLLPVFEIPDTVVIFPDI